MTDIRLNTGQVDWITITTYEESVWKILEAAAAEAMSLTWANGKEEESVSQYTGWSCSEPGRGHVFLGSGEQKGKTHIMLRASGRASNRIFRSQSIGTLVLSGIVKVTRLDVQVTIIEPDEHSQWDALNEMKQQGVNVGYFQSFDRVANMQLATVYIGSRNSDRFTRVYQKLSESGDTLLRWETEYKRERATQVARSLLESPSGAELQYLSHELKKSYCNKYRRAFDGVMNVDAAKTERIVKERAIDATYEWLMGVCIPVIDRYLSQHDSQGEELKRTLVRMIDRPA